MTRLCELAEKYGCDKTKSIFHDYTPFYHELLSKRTVKRVLEIGIGNTACMNHVKDYKPGASLRMWAEYFPEAEICGMDEHTNVLINEGRIRSVRCNQSLESDLEWCTEKLDHPSLFDFILDDGSHKREDQALTANIFIPKLLSHTGVYVIEDVLWPRELYPLLPFPVEVKMFDLRRTPDDCIFFIEGSNIY